jgi:hypothetical protein
MSQNGNGLGSNEFRRGKNGHRNVGFEEAMEQSKKQQHETLFEIAKRQKRLRGNGRRRK